MTTAIADHLISCDELSALIDSTPDVTLLDVRTGAEFESVRLANTLSLPLDAVAANSHAIAEQTTSNEAPVVLVCRSGARAAQAHQHLSEAGASDVRILDGGIEAWTSNDGAVEHGEAKWAIDRQVRFVAGSISLAGLLASIAVPRAKWLSTGVASGLVWSGISNTCAMGTALSKLPYNRGTAVDVDAVIAQINTNQQADRSEVVS